MIVRSPKPEDPEMPLDGFVDWITPIDRFFVRCHTYTPKVQYGWRLWQFDWKASNGRIQADVRATNAAGQSQPLSEQWNPSGYLWNVAQSVSVTISAQAPAATSQPSAPAAAPDSLKKSCFACHDDHMMLQQHLTRAQWDREIDKMTGWSAPLQPADRDEILNYLSSRFNLHFSHSFCCNAR